MDSETLPCVRWLNSWRQTIFIILKKCNVLPKWRKLQPIGLQIFIARVAGNWKDVYLRYTIARIVDMENFLPSQIWAPKYLLRAYQPSAGWCRQRGNLVSSRSSWIVRPFHKIQCTASAYFYPPFSSDRSESWNISDDKSRRWYIDEGDAWIHIPAAYLNEKVEIMKKNNPGELSFALKFISLGHFLFLSKASLLKIVELY